MYKVYLKTICFVLTVLFVGLCFGSWAEAAQKQDKKQPEAPQIAGEIFGNPVPIGNYYFAKQAVVSFGANWRPQPKDAVELEDLVWQELIFSFEAFNQKIEATDVEIDDEIDKMMKNTNVEFKWRVDKAEFQKWLNENVNMPLELFRNQVAHLVKLEKLRKKMIESFSPEVSEEEAYQKFLNEYNTLSVELVQFDEQDKAEEFYENSILPQNSDAQDKLILREIMISLEAKNRKIEASEEEKERALINIIRDFTLDFNWKQDTDKFNQWVLNTLGISRDELNQRITQPVKVDKLNQELTEEQILAIINDKKYQEVLTQAQLIPLSYVKIIELYAALDNDILKFNDFEQAKEFYKKIKRNAGFWDDSRRKEPNRFKRPGFTALDFLINMWGFKKEDAYKMLDLKIGSFYPPAPIYKGYGVFKILDIRKAEPEEFSNLKSSYLEKVKRIKQFDLYKEWVEKIKKQADIKVYIKQ